MMIYFLKRIAMMIPTLIGITLITFFIIRLAPGDPAELRAQGSSGMLRSDTIATSVVEETRSRYGFDQPIYLQYWRWVKQIATLDFGNSYVDHKPVMKKIAEALPITLLLNLLSIFLTYLIAVPVGLYSAMRPGSLFDRVSSLILFMLFSLPAFWSATMAITYLGGGDYLNWFPVAGFISYGAETLPWWQKMANVVWHLVLPVACLTYGGLAFLTKFSKSTVLEVIREDFMRTARAKGLSEWQVMWRHGFRNALIPMITLSGTLLPALLGGSVIIEQIFSIPGMGQLGFASVMSRDYPTIMAISTISAFLTLIGLLLSDITYRLVDPRITFGGRS